MLDRLSRLYRRFRYSPFLCQLVVVRRCNLACKYCFEFDASSSPVPRDVLIERIDKAAELGTFGLELTGGEPLLHPDLVELVRHASRHRFHMLGLISNGFLMTPEIVDRLGEAGLGELMISVDGVTPNEVTMKVLKPLRPKLEMLSTRARFKVVLSAVIGTGASLDEVREVIAFARDHGFRPRVLLLHGADGQLGLGPLDRSAFRLVQKEIGRYHRDFLDYRTRLLEKGEAPFKCRAGSRYLYVDEDGVAHWCSQTREEFGIPLLAYGEEELRRQWAKPKLCNRRCTIGCARACSMVDELFPQPG